MRNFLICFAAFGPLLSLGGAALAQDVSEEELSEALAPGISLEDPQTGLLGQFSAWLLYSTEFGATGGASGKFKLPSDDGSWVSLGGELAERRQSVNLGYHKDAALAGADLDITLRGNNQNARDVLPFDATTIGLENRLSWSQANGAKTAAYLGAARNRISNPAADLTPIIQPDVGATNRAYLGTEYSRTIALEGPVAKLRYELGAEVATISSGETQGRLRAELLAGGYLGDSVVWRANLRGGLLETAGGNASIGDRFILGGATLRGFAYGGFGPHDGDQALGGTRYATARFDMQFPRAFGADAWLIPGVHADVGSLWGLDDTAGGLVDDGSHLRSSLGLTFAAQLEHGALSLSISHAFDTQANDDTQPLQIRFDSAF